MSTKEELQAKRNELFNHSEDTIARIKELDEQIAEAEKPELRHLDYGPDSEGDMTIMVVANNIDGGRLLRASISGGLQKTSGDYKTKYPVETILGNLADDIANRGKKLKEFEIAACGKSSSPLIVHAGTSGGIWLHCPSRVYFGNTNTKEIYAKLGQVINYAKDEQDA